MQGKPAPRTREGESTNAPAAAAKRPVRPGTLPGVRRTIAAIGRSLVVVGLLILCFVAYQLWGTGYFTSRAQSDLKSDFTTRLSGVDPNVILPPPTTATVPVTPTTRPAVPVPPEIGRAHV